ncbi:hypothetical protein CWC39_00735 [Corynebacterium heidelbergense]|uniref:Uncharacterized protein n=1 Tax=Corynebacterium heidelbergense TaxID=2055947 RepID=A0A364VE45_9CORY|nr:hypothetical protein CWC39_00735 [Corynebacterium heidelbergense]
MDGAEYAVMDALADGEEHSLTVLKACVVTDHKPLVEPLMERLKGDGAVIETRKHRYRMVNK